MALGNEGNKRYDANYFSRLSFTDQETKLRLGFRFTSGMLVAGISKLKDPTTFDYETLEEIFITPTKAKILLELIEDYDSELSQGVGITAGLKETVSAIVVNHEGITIGKVNGNGQWVSRKSVKFNHEFHYGISWNNIDNNEFEKVYKDKTEFEMFKQLLKSFSENMPGAIAYSVADLARFDTSKQTGRLKPIYDKLGIEWGGNNNNSRGSGNNFFNNNTRNSGGSAEHKDMDDVIDELPFD